MANAGISSGNPKYGWGCQEASGNLVSFLDAATLTAFGGITYEVSITGWSRKAVGLGSTAAFFSSSIGNTATTSYLLLAYISLSGAPSAQDACLSVGNGAGAADRRQAAVTTGPVYRAQGTGVTAVNGTSNPGTDVRPVVLLVNRATSEHSVLTDQDKMTPTWVAPTSGTSSYVSLGDGIDTARFLYAVLFEGAPAELSRAQIKTLMQTLGWSPSWTP